MSLQKEFVPFPNFFNSVTSPVCSSTGSFIIQHKVPIFITKAPHSLSTSHLSASSRRASFSSSHPQCLSLQQILTSGYIFTAFCWPSPHR